MNADKKRILFVDDEPAILASLGNLFRKDRHRWDMVFASGGPQAVKALDTGQFDVVITDMRMPELDGAALLEVVKQRSPHTVRIMLSGHADSDSVLRALPLVHQFLSKPCDVKTLRGILERCCESSRSADLSMAGHIGGLPSLPCSPHTHAELLAALKDTRGPIAPVVAIVERDPAIAAKVLQIANTSYFGSGQQIASIAHAVATLGLEMMKELARSSMIAAAGSVELAGLSLERLREDSQRTGNAARRLCSDPVLADAAYAAGLLHDVGRIVLAVELGERYAAVVERVARTGEPVYAVETELLGITHAEVGAHLLQMWALPEIIIQAVARHHEPRALPGSVSAVVAAVQAAET